MSNQYDDLLKLQSLLSEKKNADLKLWTKIRRYEKIGKLTNELERLLTER